MNRVVSTLATLAMCTLALSPDARAASASSAWPQPPPAAAKRPVVDDYAGTKVTDAYRYFENMTDPKVQAYFKAQNAYARAVLRKLEPGRATLLSRIDALSNAGAAVTGVQRDGDYFFYEKRNPGENTLRLFVRRVGSTDERVLVDPDKLVTKPGQHYSLEYFAPSYDGKYVSYGATEGGSEAATLRIVETATGNVLPDAIDRTKYLGVTSWRSDDASFYYLRFPKLAPGQSPNEGELKPVVYLHVLGRDPEQDPAVLGFGVGHSTDIVPIDFPSVVTTPASPYAIGAINHGVQNEQTLYVKLEKDVANPEVPWQKLADVADQVTASTSKARRRTCSRIRMRRISKSSPRRSSIPICCMRPTLPCHRRRSSNRLALPKTVCTSVRVTAASVRCSASRSRRTVRPRDPHRR